MSQIYHRNNFEAYGLVALQNAMFLIISVHNKEICFKTY